MPASQKAFISYRRSSPDRDLAMAIEAFLAAENIEAFLDTHIPPGEQWEFQIERSLAECTHFIAILSADSIKSPMVCEEIRRAYVRMMRGETAILPVWIGDPVELSYALGAWLNPLQYAIWRPAEGYEGLFAVLLDAIRRRSALPLPRFGAAAAEKQRALARGAGATVSEDLLARGIQSELRPAMRDLFRVATASAEVAGMFPTDPDGSAPPPYVRRQAGNGDIQTDLSGTLHGKTAVLVTGRAGLGKTREIAEMAAAMVQRGWAVFAFDCGQTQLLLPKNIDLVPHRKTLLVFDGIQDVGGAGGSAYVPVWLKQLLDLFSARLLESDLRIVVGIRSEPQYLARPGLDPGDPFWQSFTRFDLAEFSEADLRAILRWLTEDRGVPCDPDSLAGMVAESDATPAMLVTKIDLAKRRGVRLTAELWNELRSVDWAENFERISGTEGVFESLWSMILLSDAFLPAYWGNVVDLAKRLGAHEADGALRSLIHNRLIGETSGTVRLFGAAQTRKSLIERNRPAPALSECWRLLMEVVSTPRSASPDPAGDLLRLAHACARGGNTAAALEITSRLSGSPGFQGESRYANGIFRLAAGDREGGIADLQSAVEMGRTSHETYRLLGIAQLAAGEPEKALASLTAAGSPDGFDALTSLAQSLARWQTGDAARAEQDAGTVAGCGDEIAFFALMVRGCLRMERGDMQGAATDFGQATPPGDLAGTICLLRGVALRRTDPAEAEVCLTKAMELGQSLPLAFEERGSARSSQGKYAAAEADFSAAIGFLPGGHELRFTRGVTRMLLGDWAGAESDFTAAIDSGRQESKFFSGRSASRSRQGDYSGAEDDLNRAIGLVAADNTGELSALLNARGVIRWQGGGKDEAMADFTEATRLSRADRKRKGRQTRRQRTEEPTRPAAIWRPRLARVTEKGFWRSVLRFGGLFQGKPPREGPP